MREIKADWPVRDLNPRLCPLLGLHAKTTQITRQEAHKDDSRPRFLGNTREKKKIKKHLVLYHTHFIPKARLLCVILSQSILFYF